MTRITKTILSICLVVWVVLALCVCGALDTDTMTVSEAIKYILNRTSILVVIFCITVIVEKLRKEEWLMKISTAWCPTYVQRAGAKYATCKICNTRMNVSSVLSAEQRKNYTCYACIQKARLDRHPSRANEKL